MLAYSIMCDARNWSPTCKEMQWDIGEARALGSNVLFLGVGNFGRSYDSMERGICLKMRM